jgi:CreA protein
LEAIAHLKLGAPPSRSATSTPPSSGSAPIHKIVVEAYDDPKVAGVTCYVSRAKTGGIKGALGVAEDKSEASIACRQVGPVSVKQPLPQQEEVFSERMSLLFKRLRIVRMVDRSATRWST